MGRQTDKQTEVKTLPPSSAEVMTKYKPQSVERMTLCLRQGETAATGYINSYAFARW